MLRFLLSCMTLVWYNDKAITGSCTVPGFTTIFTTKKATWSEVICICLWLFAFREKIVPISEPFYKDCKTYQIITKRGNALWRWGSCLSASGTETFGAEPARFRSNPAKPRQTAWRLLSFSYQRLIPRSKGMIQRFGGFGLWKVVVICFSGLHPGRMPVDRFKDPLLLIGIDADGLKRLTGSAVRADERFVVRARQRRVTVVEPSAQRADRRSDDVIFH